MPVAAKSLEIIAGYVLTERIGAGGYGEVWKATAPGGIEKAIKTLHGYHDEELASRELKALERIKGVRHPFLLSLDRFEIVDGRLVVVSELADMSLEDCFERHRLEGRPGIPRDQLLAYLRDAADALDFMQRQHGLQHLDIKPENLLLLGEHIKVADFGLVKEVGGCTRNSMVGGLTPTYAAPEIFDNRPAARTDQYSLAIVYQEMLTGELPFRGRTAAQLVAQHTQGRPQLGALPEHDRPVVLKALAKRPEDRYESCTAFIEALIQAANRPRPFRSDVSIPARKTTLAHDETQGAGSHPTKSIVGDARFHARAVTEPINRQSLDPLHADVAEPDQCAASDESKDSAPVSLTAALAASGMTGRAEEMEIPTLTASTRIVDRPVNELQDQASGVRPTLVIGVGGVGGRVLARLHAHGTRLDSEAAWSSLFPMIAVDVDGEALKALRQSTSAASLSPIDLLHLPLRRAQQYRERSPELLKWLSRRWLYNIPCSLKTRGYRPLGRLALVDNAETFVASIRTHWRRWKSRCEENNGSSVAMARRAGDRPRVVIIAGSGGGTGGGVAIDVANAVRKIAQQCGSAEIEITGLFADFSIEGSDASDLALANTYAFLTELATAWRSGNCGQGEGLSETQLFEADAPPFEDVYFAGLGEAEGPQADAWIEDAAEYLAADLLGVAGSTLEACRRTKSEPPADDAALKFVRSFAVASLADRWDMLQLRARYDLCRRAVARWLVASPGLPRPRHAPREKGSGFARVAGWVFRSAAKPTAKNRKPTPADVLQSLRQAIAESLGELAIGSFAEALLPFLAELLHDPTSKPTPESRAALLRRANPVITAAHQALRAALERHAVDVSDEGQFEDFEPMIELVCRVEQAAVGRCLASLAEAGETSPDLGEMLWEEAGLALDHLTTCGDPDNLTIKLAAAEPDVAEIIDSTLVRPSGCSHQRRTIVVIPESWPNNALDAEVARLRPGTAIARANVSHPIVIREAADLSLAQIAARLTETRPYAVEAACHLHARNDVPWLHLPRVEWHEAADCSL